MSSSRRRRLAVGVAAEVKNKLSVVEVVGETVSLKKAGTTYKGLCPFHGEKTPSFVVTPQRETLALLRVRTWRRHLQLRHAARQRHVPGGAPDARPARRRRDRRAHPARGRPQGAPAQGPRQRDRLLPRGADRLERRQARPRLPPRPRLHRRDHRDLPARLGAGRLGPDDPDARRPSATSGPRSSSRSASPRRARAAGAASTTSSVPASLFPIRDQNGHAVGLGGRLLEGDGPKYLNSPATPLFDKSRTLYLIDKAKGPDPQARPGGHRRGLHRRADGAPGRLRQRRGQPRHRADAGPGRAADPLRDPDRARLRRRRGRREGRRRRDDRAGRAHRRAPARHLGGQARGRPRRAAARRQGPRRGRPRVAGRLGDRHRQGQAARSNT